MIIRYFLTALPVFLIIDMIWLVLVARKFYARHLGYIMRTDVMWIPAIIFYLIFLAGLVVFVITPAIEKHSWTNALLFGALFGLVSYATYDLTNLATLRDWPVIVTIVDLIWGSVLSGSVALITYLVSTR